MAQKRTVPFFAWSLLESVGLTEIQMQSEATGDNKHLDELNPPEGVGLATSYICCCSLGLQRFVNLMVIIWITCLC